MYILFYPMFTSIRLPCTPRTILCYKYQTTMHTQYCPMFTMTVSDYHAHPVLSYVYKCQTAMHTQYCPMLQVSDCHAHPVLSYVYKCQTAMHTQYCPMFTSIRLPCTPSIVLCLQVLDYHANPVVSYVYNDSVRLSHQSVLCYYLQ